MWYWIPSIAAAVLVAFWIQAHRRFLGHWRRLGKVLDALGEGREPGSYVFLNGGRFEEISPRLQKLAQEQARLRKLAEDERFNLRTILASMEEGVMVVDGHHVLRLVNPSFTALFELRADPVGQTVLHTLRET
ncbi:MAG TPA: PAS domain-containing protein, partial [Chthoniobacteraceae bacterium]